MPIPKDLHAGLIMNTSHAIQETGGILQALGAIDDKSLRRAQLKMLAVISMTLATLTQAYLLNCETTVISGPPPNFNPNDLKGPISN